MQAFHKTTPVRRTASRAPGRKTEHENINAEQQHSLFDEIMATNDGMSQQDDEDNGLDSPEDEHLLWDLESLGSSTLFPWEPQQDKMPSQLE